jgi:hypothetical protein
VTAIGGIRIRFRLFGILHIGACDQIATIERDLSAILTHR